MKSLVSRATAAAALIVAGFLAVPCAALPMARLSSTSLDTSVIKINGVHVRHHRHHHYYYRPLLYVGRGVYYGCRPGWYCFGPPLRPNFSHAWYGGFNSIYGYQGARWRPPLRDAETTTTPSSAAPRSDHEPPPEPPPPTDQPPPPAGTK